MNIGKSLLHQHMTRQLYLKKARIIRIRRKRDFITLKTHWDPGLFLIRSGENLITNFKQILLLQK